jgi:rSAM/selenodomain-associated transferase 1
MSFESLLVFLKAPRLGQVKTRLALTLGDKAACAAYCRLVETVLVRISSLPKVRLVYAPADGAGEIQSWTRPGWEIEPQAAGDLGHRLHSAFLDAFARGAQRVVIIGSDCPAITANDITTAWSALKTAELVLGPATDGGYWLIGLRQPQVALFENMAWSTATVFQDTLNRAQTAGLMVSLLRELADVDTEADWRAFLETERKAGEK